jgi:hypothetical protein
LLVFYRVSTALKEICGSISLGRAMARAIIVRASSLCRRRLVNSINATVQYLRHKELSQEINA